MILELLIGPRLISGTMSQYPQNYPNPSITQVSLWSWSPECQQKDSTIYSHFIFDLILPILPLKNKKQQITWKISEYRRITRQSQLNWGSFDCRWENRWRVSMKSLCTMQEKIEHKTVAWTDFKKIDNCFRLRIKFWWNHFNSYSNNWESYRKSEFSSGDSKISSSAPFLKFWQILFIGKFSWIQFGNDNVRTHRAHEYANSTE